MSEQTKTDLVTMDANTGEIIESPPADLDALVKRTTGGMEKTLKTSFDVTTPEGKDGVSRHLAFSPDPNAKQNDGWIGKEFNLIGFTSRAVRSTKDKEGKARSEPLILIRTVLEADEDRILEDGKNVGRLVSSASDYVYSSLMEIISFCGAPSVKNPIRVKVVKAGQADKLVRVFNAHKSASTAPVKKA